MHIDLGSEDGRMSKANVRQELMDVINHQYKNENKFSKYPFTQHPQLSIPTTQFVKISNVFD